MIDLIFEISGTTKTLSVPQVVARVKRQINKAGDYELFYVYRAFSPGCLGRLQFTAEDNDNCEEGFSLRVELTYYKHSDKYDNHLYAASMAKADIAYAMGSSAATALWREPI